MIHLYDPLHEFYSPSNALIKPIHTKSLLEYEKTFNVNLKVSRGTSNSVETAK